MELQRVEVVGAFNRAARVPTPELDGEGFLAVDAYARIKLAPPLPKVPTIVLSSDKFPPPADLGPDDYTKFQIHQANSLLAETLARVPAIVDAIALRDGPAESFAPAVDIATMTQQYLHSRLFGS